MSTNLPGKRRYRIGNYRILCDIKDQELVVITIEIGHRSRIYR
ncbi:type II toxin-antitoxin system RelE/ParE family toxin [Varibaculum cambriense]